MQTPHQITILRNDSGGFSVLTAGWSGPVQVIDGLCYDEMLGQVARLLCPVMSNGEPQRYMGRPLFLTAPKISHSTLP